MREELSTPEEVSAVFAALWGELGECGEEG